MAASRTAGAVVAHPNGNGHEPDDEDGPVFDLDALELDTQGRPPFRFTLKGREIELVEPRELPWQLQRAFQEVDVEAFVPHMFADDADRSWFEQLELPIWKLDKLIEAWFRHSRLNLGESQASPPSSKPTGKPSRQTSDGGTTSASRTSRQGG